uniref:Apple domain-containing protein n=1 Tax=Syphacia muris TaxID=451379 RepID=A0A0N5ANH5_9BILA
MDEKIYSICEEYFECEAIAKLQDRLCVGNSLNPYWLPTASDDKCYLKLKNDYIHSRLRVAMIQMDGFKANQKKKTS